MGRYGSLRAARWRRRALYLLIPLVVLALAAGGTAYEAIRYYDHRMERAPLVDPPQSQARSNVRTLDLLLFGSGSDGGSAGVLRRKLDMVMVVHFDRTLDHATVVSIPRSAYVEVPAGGSWSGGRTTLDRSIVVGGAPAVARTVGNLTGISLDGALIADLDRIDQLVDAVGGITVCVTDDERLTGGGVRKAGCHELDGDQAEEFMRGRRQDRGDDSARIDDQQRVMKALMRKMFDAGVLTNPLKLKKVLGAAADGLIVDERLDVARLALSVRHIRPGNIEFASVPIKRADLPTPDGPAVELDPVLAGQMFASIRHDQVTGWLAKHRPGIAK